jgi:hypothetical protein
MKKPAFKGGLFRFNVPDLCYDAPVAVARAVPWKPVGVLLSWVVVAWVCYVGLPLLPPIKNYNQGSGR